MDENILMRKSATHSETAPMLRARNGWIFAFSAAVAAAIGCNAILGRELNPEYCAAHPDDVDCMREMPTGYFPCKSSIDCAGQEGKPACTEPAKNGFGICVQCTASDAAACVGTTPLCEEENVCRGCSRHAECGSAACLPDGSCVDEGNVAYVASTGTGAMCTKSVPCGTVSAAVATGKPYLKVAAGTVKETQATVLDGRSVTILAEEGAKLDRDGDDNPVIRVQGASDVKIYDLEVTGASGAGAHGIELTAAGSPKLAVTRVRVSGNQGAGISMNGGTLTVTQSTISGNQGVGLSAQGGTLRVTQSTVSGNQGGGISTTNATFDVTNNFVVGNGNPLVAGSELGGVLLQGPPGSSRFEFNTVAFNAAKQGTLLAAGIACSVPDLIAPGNIVTSNSEGFAFPTQTKGTCSYGNSFTAPGSDMNTLKFKSITTSPPDFHLTAESPSSVVDAGGACTGVDVDGEARPHGAACDLGADEYR